MKDSCPRGAHAWCQEELALHRGTVLCNFLLPALEVSPASVSLPVQLCRGPVLPRAWQLRLATPGASPLPKGWALQLPHALAPLTPGETSCLDQNM